ncbi:MAG: hypothetical protein RMH77_03360 [Sulfolobales archaeon]|nr:hypothetical protein [Sulfolobales archaeon]MCX8186134.1 hypothetical protein [Sulfolobales archaeon]MDW7969429.1 hypothetical protein [Sulfolobales archaeon]
MSRSCCVIKLLTDLGIRSDFRSFKDRLLAQKIVYVAQTIFNINFGYKFIWHIRGPYSKTLSRDLRASEDRGGCRCQELDYSSVSKLKSMLSELRGLNMDVGLSLEIIASYLMLSRDVFPKPEDPVKELLSRKPYINYENISTALNVFSKYF